jgi:hypothetical protein
MTIPLDCLSMATKLATTPGVRFNAGFPLTLGYRPITISPLLGDPDPNTPPGTNIYRTTPTYRNTSVITRDTINLSVKARILQGGKGDTTDYAGCIMMAFYSHDPDAWSNLFYSKTQKMTIPRILVLITGIPEYKASLFVRGSEDLFPGGDNLDPLGQEKVFRAQLRF